MKKTCLVLVPHQFLGISEPRPLPSCIQEQSAAICSGCLIQASINSSSKGSSAAWRAIAMAEDLEEETEILEDVEEETEDVQVPRCGWCGAVPFPATFPSKSTCRSACVYTMHIFLIFLDYCFTMCNSIYCNKYVHTQTHTHIYIYIYLPGGTVTCGLDT